MSTIPPERFDAIIIGSGQGGKPLCLALAKASWKTARVAYLARRAADYGVEADRVLVDLAKVRRRKQALVESFRSGSQAKLENTPNVTLLFGEARFTGPKAVEVALNDGGTRRLTAEKVFINTGARPAVPA